MGERGNPEVISKGHVLLLSVNPGRVYTGCARKRLDFAKECAD